MQFDWSTLGQQAPTTLVRARQLAHHAAQWAAKAAHANLDRQSDDAHADLAWDAERAALMSLPLPGAGADVRIGLRIAALEIVVMRGAAVLDTYSLEGRTDAMIGVWFDSALRALGLKPAADCALPYSVAYHPATKRSAQVRAADAAALDELARWLAAAADVLHDIAARRADASAVRCSPHHFELATTWSLDDGAQPRSIRAGVSLGDSHYAQPYAFVIARPHPPTADLPALPQPGMWHTQGFVGAVATGEEILRFDDRRQKVVDFVDAAAQASVAAAGAGAAVTA